MSQEVMLDVDGGVPGIDFGNAQLNKDIAEGMARCEELLTQELSSGEDFLVETINHLASAGGKRFRPMFALLAAQFGQDPQSEDVYKAAVMIELIHLATLYHDDVMDEAEKRRGVPSANARWDNSVAILAGDYLFAVASKIMADLGTETVAHFARTFAELVTGQMRETVGHTPGDTPVQHYMKVIREKTGVLIASAGYLGALHAGAEPEVTVALSSYGRNMGQVFQIVDDFIDIFSDAEQSGKVPGTDLREGVFTLPVLYALEEEGPVGDELRELLTGPIAENQVEHAIDLIGRTRGRQRALEDIENYTQRARKDLEQLPDIPVKAGLQALLDYSRARVA